MKKWEVVLMDDGRPVLVVAIVSTRKEAREIAARKNHYEGEDAGLRYAARRRAA